MNISIIIPAYNSQDWIEECLDSIHNQDYFQDVNNKYEILVGVDNCKKTLNKIKDIWHKYSNVRVFWMKKNKGCYVVRNTIIPLTNYENIIIFDSDDIMMPNMISEICKNVELYIPDILQYKYTNFTDILNIDNITTISKHFTQGTIFLKKDIFFLLDGFMDWICSADSDFITKTKTNSSIKNFKMDKSLLYRRVHGNNLTQNALTGLNSELRIVYQTYTKKITSKNIIKNKIVQNKYREIFIDTNIKNIRESKRELLENKIRRELKKYYKIFQKHNIVISSKPVIQQPTIQQPTIQQPTIQQPTIQQPTIQPPEIKTPPKIITQHSEKGNIYVISSQETSRQLKTIQDSIKEFNIIEPTPLDFPEVLNLSYLFEQKLKHDKREIAKKKKEISYSITIRNIIKKEKENKSRKVIIFQDGITFDKNPNTIIPQLEELPDNFGVCFLGGYFRKPFLGSFYEYNEHFLELKGSFKIWGTHAIVIGQEIYDILIKALTINFDKNFQELLCSIIVGKYPSYTYNIPFVFYDEHFSNRYAINNVPVKTLKQDNLNIIKKSKNNK